MSATLGGLLKDFRLQHNISQLEIALAMGWKETSRLSRIEQGKIVKPTRELLERVMEAMKLKEEEKNQLLYVGNYLPTRKEIQRIQKLIFPIIENVVYPIAVFDFSWRIIIDNDAICKLYGLSKKQQKINALENPHMLEIVCDPNFSLNKSLSKEFIKARKLFMRAMLQQFIFDQSSRTKEKWYLDLIKKMMNNPIFKAAWDDVINSNSKISPVFLPSKSVIHPGGLKLNLYLSVVRLNIDPRFFIEINIPGDVSTFNFFQEN